jgi:hypothetical protein
MTDAAPKQLDERTLYALFRQDGNEPDKAIQLAREAMAVRAGKQDPQWLDAGMDPQSAAVVNRVSGASAGFDDEIAGALAAGKAKLSGGDALPAYRKARDERRALKTSAKQYDPHPVLNEMGGALLTAPLLGAGQGLAGAIRTGAAYGATLGLGNSNADLTQGDLGELGNAAIDTGVGGVIGGAAGAAGYGLASAAGRTGRYLLDNGAEAIGKRTAAQSAAQAVARDVAGSASEPAASSIGRSKTVDQAFRGGQEIEKDVTAELQKSGAMPKGERYRLKASQLTGQRDAALAERLSEQSPKTMNDAQVLVSKAKDYGEQFIDQLVNQVAANPEKLNTPQLAEDVTSGVKSYLEILHNKRSIDTKPLYDAFEKAGGYMPESEIRAGIMNAISKDTPLETITQPVTKKLNAVVDEIVSKAQAVRARSGVANEDTQLSVSSVNDIRKWLVKVTRRESSLGVDGMSPSEQKRIASIALDGIDSAFDNVVAQRSANPANAQAAQAVDYLRQANALWKERTGEIRSAATKTVRRLIDAASEDTSQDVVTRLATMKEQPLKAVFTALEASDAKAGTSVARDLRAQLWLNTMEAGGKIPRGAEVSQELGTRELPAMAIMRANTQREGALIRGAFKGDARAQYNYLRVQRLLQRLSFGPNIRGSDTTPLLMAEADRQGMQLLNSAGPGGKVASGALHLARQLIGSADRTAEAFSTDEGLDAFGKALEIAIASQTGKQITAAMSKALTTSIRQAGLSPYGDWRNQQMADARQIRENSARLEEIPAAQNTAVAGAQP